MIRENIPSWPIRAKHRNSHAGSDEPESGRFTMFETTMTAIAAAIAMIALLLMAVSSVLQDLLESYGGGERKHREGRFNPGAGPCPDNGGSSGQERRSGDDLALLETRPAQLRPVPGGRLPAPPALVDRPIRFGLGGPRPC